MSETEINILFNSGLLTKEQRDEMLGKLKNLREQDYPSSYSGEEGERTYIPKTTNKPEIISEEVVKQGTMTENESDKNIYNHQNFKASDGITYTGTNDLPNVHASSIDNQDNIQPNIIYDPPELEPDGSRIVTGVDVVSGTQKQENPIEDPFAREIMYGKPRAVSEFVDSSSSDLDNLTTNDVGGIETLNRESQESGLTAKGITNDDLKKINTVLNSYPQDEEADAKQVISQMFEEGSPQKELANKLIDYRASQSTIVEPAKEIEKDIETLKRSVEHDQEIGKKRTEQVLNQEKQRVENLVQDAKNRMDDVRERKVETLIPKETTNTEQNNKNISVDGESLTLTNNKNDGTTYGEYKTKDLTEKGQNVSGPYRTELYDKGKEILDLYKDDPEGAKRHIDEIYVKGTDGYNEARRYYEENYHSLDTRQNSANSISDKLSNYQSEKQVANGIEAANYANNHKTDTITPGDNRLNSENYERMKAGESVGHAVRKNGDSKTEISNTNTSGINTREQGASNLVKSGLMGGAMILMGNSIPKNDQTQSELEGYNTQLKDLESQLDIINQKITDMESNGVEVPEQIYDEQINLEGQISDTKDAIKFIKNKTELPNITTFTDKAIVNFENGNPLDSFKEIQNESSGYMYNEDDAKKVETNIGIIKDNSMRLRGIVGVILDDIYNNLLEETKKNINFSSIAYGISSYLSSDIIAKLEDSEQNVSWSRKKAKRTDGGGHGSSHGTFSNINSNPDNSKTTDNEEPTEPEKVDELGDTEVDNSIDDETNSVDDVSNVSEVETENNSELTENVSKAVLGMVSFLEIVPLFEKLGENSTIDSSVDSSYKLIGIEKYNGNYYYKIEEEATEKTYYVLINDKVKLESSANEIVEVKEPTLKLATPDLNGDNNYAEVLNSEEVFIMTGKENSSSDKSIEMAKIFDFNSGKEGYIQISDRIEIKSIDSLVNDNNE